MKQGKEHLSIYGIGPVYGATVIALTVAACLCVKFHALTSGTVRVLQIPSILVGMGLFALGLYIWISSIFQAKIDEGILKNHLVTDGVYAHVRNPIYSGITFVCIGVLFTMNNLWLLLLPFLFWGYLTILLVNTEEKWLHKLYGEEYEEYCGRVNRCIPWF